MKSRPLTCTAESVLGYRDGRKTQTRRVMVPQPWNGEPCSYGGVNFFEQHIFYPDRDNAYEDGDYDGLHKCKYGVPGDLLYLRETWRPTGDHLVSKTGAKTGIHYRADNARIYRPCDLSFVREYPQKYKPPVCWRSPRFMPKWAARYWREITEVRAEHLQDITTDDALAEGVHSYPQWDGKKSALQVYQEAWDSINAKRGHPWAANDFVWVIESKEKEAGR